MILMLSLRKMICHMERYLALQKIVEMKSFTKAAEALGYTQSSVSQMIASLENELSMKLLVRSRTGVKLTLEGKELYPFIEKPYSNTELCRKKRWKLKGWKQELYE